MSAEGILAIDTSAGTSVAVLLKGRGFERSSEDSMRHAEAIGDLLRLVLEDAGIGPEIIGTVVAGMGPGPFTGLRVGIAAAQAFALGRNLDIAPVVSHDAPVWRAYRAGSREETLVVTDARRKEVYWSRYDLSGSSPVLVEGPALARPEDLPHSHLTRIEYPPVSALALAERAAQLAKDGVPFTTDRALYLRAPDVTPSPGPKRVTR